MKFWMKIEEVLVLLSIPCYILWDSSWSCSQVSKYLDSGSISNIYTPWSGAFLPWRLAVFLPLVLCLPTFLCILFLHESPDWLRKKGRLVQYKQSMAFYQKCQVPSSSYTDHGK